MTYCHPHSSCQQRLGEGLPFIRMHGRCGLYPPYHSRVVFRVKDSAMCYFGETVPTHDAGHPRCEPAFYVEGLNKLFLALEVVEWQLGNRFPLSVPARSPKKLACC